MTPSEPTTDGPPRGWVTLMATLAFVVLFRLEQNAAYVLGLPSARALVTSDEVPISIVVHLLAPFLHATPGHLVSTLAWFVPFGYFLERRTAWRNYLSFVVIAGLVTTTLVPVAFFVVGAAPGLGVGASGITHALVGREAAARGRWAIGRRSHTRRQWAILAVSVGGFLIGVVGVLSGLSEGTPVLGHATGLALGTAVGIGEGYVSVTLD